MTTMTHPTPTERNPPERKPTERLPVDRRPAASLPPLRIDAVLIDALPCVVSYSAALAISTVLPLWIGMWFLTAAVFFSLKWLVWRRTYAALPNRTPARFWTWLLLWPGMNPAPFFVNTSSSASAASRTPPSLAAQTHTGPFPTTSRQWLAALAKTAVGLAALGAAGPIVYHHSPLAAGWIGMFGLIMLMHCGVFHLAALAWRRAGVAVEPIMDNPLKAATLAEFWSRRWNRAFRDLVEPLVFRPLVRRYGPRVASWGVFLFSGVIHDLVITVPARGGYGLPTLYFLIQAAAIELARSPLGKRFRLRHGLGARLLAAVALIAPLGLLAPRPFIENCIVPLVSLWS